MPCREIPSMGQWWGGSPAWQEARQSGKCAPRSGKCESMETLPSLSPPAGTREGGGFTNKVLGVSGKKGEGGKVDI